MWGIVVWTPGATSARHRDLSNRSHKTSWESTNARLGWDLRPSQHLKLLTVLLKPFLWHGYPEGGHRMGNHVSMEGGLQQHLVQELGPGRSKCPSLTSYRAKYSSAANYIPVSMVMTVSFGTTGHNVFRLIDAINSNNFLSVFQMEHNSTPSTYE